MEKCDTVGTPMAAKPKLDADLSVKLVDQTDYRSKIRSLMYLTSSRPDIVQAVYYYACYQARLTEKHLKEVKKIFRYLRGTVNMELWNPKDSRFKLTTFTDADHVRCLDTRKSTSGGIQFMGDKFIVAQVILILSDSSDESVGSSSSRIMFFGNIPTEIPTETHVILPVAREVEVARIASPAGVLDLITYSSSDSDSDSDPLEDLPSPKHVSTVSATSLFLCNDLSKAFDSYSFERTLSPDSHKTAVARWSSKVALHSSSSETLSPTHDLPPAPDGVLKMLTARKRVHPVPTCVPANRRMFRSSPSSLPRKRHRSSSSSSSSYSPPATTTIDDSPARPSCKRCRSSTMSVPLAILAPEALSPTCVDLLLPCKRFRSSSAALSLKASIKGEEEDIDFEIIADIEAYIAAEAAIAEEVRAEIDVGFERDDKAEEEVESSARSTMEIGIDKAIELEITKEIPTPVTNEGDIKTFAIELDVVIQELYDHMVDIPIHRIADVEEEKRRQEVRALSDKREMTRLHERFSMLEGSNTRSFESYEGNGGGNGNGNCMGGGNGDEDPNMNAGGFVPVARECTYQDFLKCQPLIFKRTWGVFGLTRDVNPICNLGDYSKHGQKGYRNTIELPVRNNVVPLRSDTIQLVQNKCSFYGLQSEDPNQHLKDFLILVDSLELDGENRERMRLTTKLRNVILMFQQHHGESISEARTRFKDLLQKVPHYGIDHWLQIQIFYDHVLFHLKCEIDYAAGGKIRSLKHMNALVDQGSDVNIMPLSTYLKLTNKRPAEMDIRLSLASHSYIYPLGLAENVLVEVAEHVHTVDFAVIKFDKDTITLRSEKSKLSFNRIPESLYKDKKGIKNDIEPIALTMIANRLVLEWEEKIKLHQEKEMEFDR
uniref:Uncharacterized mitochondrial protein AtMg00810-like n=1 Tax=Tanacetum cinerariifolium TaxID=118510 RepID=A0A6L2JSV4_TANCI|nr:uncharacterized mitochondrial protein AtMg00810-like [Tanacetum cinerariifolium]